jgi:hypothetical protein
MELKIYLSKHHRDDDGDGDGDVHLNRLTIELSTILHFNSCKLLINWYYILFSYFAFWFIQYCAYLSAYVLGIFMLRFS